MAVCEECREDLQREQERRIAAENAVKEANAETQKAKRRETTAKASLEAAKADKAEAEARLDRMRAFTKYKDEAEAAQEEIQALRAEIVALKRAHQDKLDAIKGEIERA